MVIDKPLCYCHLLIVVSNIKPEVKRKKNVSGSNLNGEFLRCLLIQHLKLVHLSNITTFDSHFIQ